jgi:hypothetical protein
MWVLQSDLMNGGWLTYVDHALLQQLPERQKRDQTQMLQALAAGKMLMSALWVGLPLADHASELSADIKGERLRFVDAMKEATTLNVHCE